MADLTQNVTPNRLGPPEATLLAKPCGVNGLLAPDANGSTGITIYGGALVGYTTTGTIDNIDSTTSTIVTVAGWNGVYHSSAAGAPPGATLINLEVLKGAGSFLKDSTISGATPYGSDLYAVDNQTLSLDPGSSRIRVGFFEGLDPSNTANVICQVGQASPNATSPVESATGGTPFRAAYVMATVGANTGTGTGQLTITATGVFGTQYGVTPKLNDVVFIQPGTTNVAAIDSGPWQITTLGATGVSGVLTRPSWFQHGSIVPVACTIDIGSAGTSFAGSAWRSFASPGCVVDTTDPAFYVRQWTGTGTLVTGFVTFTGQTVPGIRSLTQTQLSWQRTNFSGGGLTVHDVLGAITNGGAATTIGYAGTASFSITALIAAGTFNTNDVGGVLASITNW